MIIDHIGIACKNLEASAKKYLMLGFEAKNPLAIEDLERNCKYLFMENKGYMIELIAILDKNKPSDLGNLLINETFGQKIYHVCYKSSDLFADIERLCGDGFKLIHPPRAAVACENREVAFLYNIDLGLIELIEEA